MYQSVFLAILYIIYGVIKIGVGISIMILPISIIQQIPILKTLAKEAEDKTIAGRVYEYVLLVFGIYTILHGFSILHYLSKGLEDLYEEKWFHYIVFITLGLILTIFYGLIIYTDIPIPKNKDYIPSYRLFGLYGGIIFLAIPIIWELMEYILPWFDRLSVITKSFVLAGITIIAIIIIDILYKFLKKKNIKPHQFVYEQVQQRIIH